MMLMVDPHYAHSRLFFHSEKQFEHDPFNLEVRNGDSGTVCDEAAQ